MKKFLIIIPIIILSGCMTQEKCWKRFPPSVNDSIITEILYRDSTIYITDSAGITALLECDSLGKVRIKQIKDFYAGQFVKPSIVIRDNWLKADCKIDSGRVYFTWKETHVKEVKTKVFVKITNKLTGLQNFLCWSGGILWCIFLIWIIIKILIKVLPAGKAVEILSKI
jgi:hypothetical protein